MSRYKGEDYITVGYCMVTRSVLKYEFCYSSIDPLAAITIGLM